jgi:type VI protein secretion system component Hcp
MSFIAKLQLQNEDEISVLRCSFRFNQNIDVTGKASSRPMGGTINLTLSSFNHPGLFEWMINTSQMKNGKVTFIRHDTMSRFKTLEFENALCIAYHESFDPSAEYPMVLQLTLSAHTIKLEDTVFKNTWPGL